MLCENCSRKEGSIHIVKVIEGNRIEKWLCTECADKNSDLTNYSYIRINDEEDLDYSLLSGIINSKNDLNSDLECSECNTKYSEFKKSGLLGCNNCYEIFRNIIDKLFLNIYADVNYIGKIPQKENEIIINNKRIIKLKEDLQMAILKEEYEKAILIRDEIKALEERNKN